MIYDIESRLVRTAADQLGIPVYDNILSSKRLNPVYISDNQNLTISMVMI